MKNSEIKDMKIEDIKNSILKLKKDFFNFKIEKRTTGLSKPHLYRAVRLDLARYKTELNCRK